MANIRPFVALRPNKNQVEQVAALPYDVFSRSEAAEYVEDKPYSFLNIDRPETQFNSSHDMYADDVYQKAASMLKEWTEQGVFIQEEKPCYYLYELTMNGRSQTGIVGAASIDDYLEGRCKKHENTVEAKEQDRIRHVDITSAHTGPIFLAYRSQAEIDIIVSQQKQNKPLYDFISEDGVGHRIWRIDNDKVIKDLSREIQSIPATYIADGHHRNASAVKVGLKRRQQYPDFTGEEEFNYYLSISFPSNELKILDYNRFVSDLNGLDKDQFLNRLSQVMEITVLDQQISPQHKGQVVMYLDGQWYALDIKQEIIDKKEGPVNSLDVAILQEEVLSPILNIQDPRTDSRISFVGGIRGLTELENMVNAQEGSVAFGMYPTSIEELFDVADAGLLMPPKSTWFEPKPRSGLLIHLFEK